MRSRRAVGRGGRRRWAVPAALALVVGMGLGASTVSAAEDPEFEFVPEGTYVRALDAAGNDITQAGGRLDRLKVRFEFPTTGSLTTRPITFEPVGMIRDLHVALPEGLQGNPEAAAKCPAATVSLNPDACPRDSKVGRLNYYYRGTSGAGIEENFVYNVEPPEGVTARFVFVFLGGIRMPLDMRVNSDGSYRVESSMRGMPQILHVIWAETEIWGVPATKNGSGSLAMPLLTMGSQCGVESSVPLRATSWATPSQWIESATPWPALTGCDRLQFQPRMDVRPTSNAADAPSGYRFKLDVPQSQAPNGLGTPPLKRAEVLFPEGTAISPGGANGLVGCSDEQAAIGVDASPDCPAASRIGSVQIDTPVLDVPLKGGVFIGTPKSQDSQTGEMFRVFLQASAKGVDIKQEGKIFPDPVTGRLRAVFDNTPQQPFEAMTIDLDGGPGAALVNPPTCGTKTTTATLASWGGQSVTSESSFEIACRPGLGDFLPSFKAGAFSPQAGISTPFNLSVGNLGGGSPLNGMRLELPKGLLANLKGNIGTQVGTVSALAGTGAAPFQLPGKAYLEGPYGDAPFSLRVVVPAKAGPFDLGEVVVKQKLYVDPKDAHVTIVSDPIPTILQGVPTRIQRLDVNVDKPGFMINPTSCEASTIGGVLSSSTGQTSGVSTRFQVGGCGDLDLDPALSLKWTDKSQMVKGKHPGVEATVVMPKGGANLRNVQVTLPLTAALDPDNARALCEPAAAAARSCPEASIIGQASANTPTLDQPVSGPVYFVKGTRVTAAGKVIPTLPKLYLKLSGQGVSIDVHADSSVTGPAGKQKLVTTFVEVPDVPINDFVLKIDSGDNGILKATNDVCGADKGTTAVFTGHNGRVTRKSMRFTAPECLPQIVSASGGKSAVSVRVGGIGAGRLTLSGSRIPTVKRTILASDAATLKARPRLTRQAKALLAQGRTVRVAVKVTFKPRKGKAVTMKRTVAIEGVKRSAS